MAKITLTFVANGTLSVSDPVGGLGLADRTGAITVSLTADLPAEPSEQVYEIDALTAPWSNQEIGSTADQTAIIQAQIDAVPDGVPGSPNIIRFPVGLSTGKYFTQGDLANNPRGTNGVLNFTDRHHLIIEGPSAANPATFYTVSPAVPWSSEISLNQHSLRRHFWFQGCTNITVRDSIRVEGSNYTFAPNLANGTPTFWLGGADNGGLPTSRGYRAPWELEHAFAFDGCDTVVFAGQCQDVWGDGVYLGRYGVVGCTNVTIGAAVLVGTGRQGVAMSFAADVLVDGVQIGTDLIRPRRAAFDLEPVTTWVVERVEVQNFEVWMGNMVTIAALGSSRVDDIHFHDGVVHGGGGSKCEVGASNGVQRANWIVESIVWDGPFGSPQAAMRFTKVVNVTVRNVDVPIATTQSRKAVGFVDCTGTLIVENSRFPGALWVDYLNSSIPQLVNNTPVLTLRNQ